MKKLKIPIVVLVLTAVAGVAYGWFFYWNKPQQNIKAAASITVSAIELFNLYSTNEQKANQSYIDKIVQVTGEVAAVTKNTEGKTVVLLKTNDPLFGVNCTMEEEADMKMGETLTLKGMCTGYLTDVVIIRCYKVK